MGIIRVKMKRMAKPTAEQIKEVKLAVESPHTYDEECPPFSDEELKKFQRVNDFIEEKVM